MGKIIDNVRKMFSSPVETKAVALNDPRWALGTSFGTTLTNPAPNGRNVRVNGFEGNAVASACIRTIASVAGAIPLEAYRYDGQDNIIIEYKHPLVDMMAHPVGNLSPLELRTHTFACLVTYGNAFWQIIRANSGRPQSIRLIHPEWNIIADRDNETGNIVQYRFLDDLGHNKTVPVEDMIHFRDLNLKDPYFGWPRAASALLELQTDIEANNYVRQILANDGKPGLVVAGENMTIDELKAAESAWSEKMVTRGGRGKTVFIGGNVSLTPIGFDLNALEFPDLRRISREGICASFGVDPRMIGIGSATADGGLSGVQYAESKARLFDHTIKPLMQIMEETLNTSLTTEFGEIYVRFAQDEINELVTNRTELSSRIVAEYRGGIRGFRESRLALGLAEDFPADDVIYTPPPPTQIGIPNG